ncbi:MAG: prohibitin family protein [Candidatus Melainabacteria bacterium]|nr:prohibitin family protein [Candidatus Melainabacteria bacterium]
MTTSGGKVVQLSWPKQGPPVWLLGLLGLVFLSQCFTVISPGYRGVSVTLGKVNPNFLGEGLNFKLPLIQQVIPIRVQQTTIEGKAECFSSDLQSVNISFKALYRIPESKVVELYRDYQGDPYYSLVEPRIQDALKQVSATYRAEHLVKSRAEVKAKALQIVQQTLALKNGFSASDLPIVASLEAKAEALRKQQEVADGAVEPSSSSAKIPNPSLTATEAEKKLVPTPSASSVLSAASPQTKRVAEPEGIFNAESLVNLVDLPISNIDLTDELERAIEQKQIKEQEALAKRYELDKARKEAEITVVNAEAEARAVLIKGQALKASPEVIQLDIVKKWDGKTPHTVVAGHGGANVLLPLR